MPDSFYRFYKDYLLELVRKKTTKKPLIKPKNPKSRISGYKTCATQNFSNKRNALYQYLGSEATTTREWIKKRYDDKLSFFNENYVSLLFTFL